MYERFGQFIDGKWQKSQNNETYEVINPATEEILGHASKACREDVEKALLSYQTTIKQKRLKGWVDEHKKRRGEPDLGELINID